MKKIASIILLIIVGVTAFAQSRNALLIANGKYTHFSSLANPVPEANELKKSLIELGFDVKVVANASKEEMEIAILNFQKELQAKKGIGFFHYGGHAVQVNGENYLIPADADIPDEPRVSSRAVNVTEVMASMVADTNIVILDSCRNNPLPSGAGRSASRGLQMVKVKPKNSVIVYSAEAGKVAQDGIFTPILTKKILENKELISVLRDVRNEVDKVTNGEQTPGQYDQLKNEVFLAMGIPSRLAKVEQEANQLDKQLQELRAKRAKGNTIEQQNAEIELQRVEAEAKRKQLELQQVKEAEAKRAAEAKRLAEEEAKKNENQKAQDAKFAQMQAENAKKLKEIEQLQTDTQDIDDFVKSANAIANSINEITNSFTNSMNKAISDSKTFYQQKRDAIAITQWETTQEFNNRKKQELIAIDANEKSDIAKIKSNYQNEIENGTVGLKKKLASLANQTISFTGSRVKLEFLDYQRDEQRFPVKVTDINSPDVTATLYIDVTSPDTATRIAKCQEVDNCIKSNSFVGVVEYGIILENDKYIKVCKTMRIKNVNTQQQDVANVDFFKIYQENRRQQLLQEQMKQKGFVFIEDNNKTSAFYICDHEVTQKEWQDIMGNNPSDFKGDNRPVERVSWYDAVEYCNKRSEKEGLTPCYSGNGQNIKCDFNANGYRLPTEAEWEYAARGGNKSGGYRYSGSNNIDEVAWYNGNSGSQTHDVKQKKPNELGIYDMSGNVWEWCWDLYESSPKTSKDYAGPGSGSGRVIRGGGWGSVGKYCDLSCRGSNAPGGGYYNLGFRLVSRQ